MAKTENEVLDSGGEQSHAPPAARRRPARGLVGRIVLYHAILAAASVLVVLLFPSFAAQLPIGGISVLAESGELTVGQAGDAATPGQSNAIVGSLLEATNQLDRLGYARQLVIVLLGVWLLMLPVSWVQKGIHRTTVYDHSLDETTLILPGVVAAIVLVVQHSLALAFSLAGIVAGVQFRRALQDTFDALFILVAIGVGIAAGIGALEIAAILTVFFSYATLYVYSYGDGFQSDYDDEKKLSKRLRKHAKAHHEEDADRPE